MTSQAVEDLGAITDRVIINGVERNDAKSEPLSDDLVKKSAVQITYLLTPWIRVLLDKLTGFQLVFVQ